MGIQNLMGLDWWLWKLAPRAWFRSYLARKIAKWQRFTDLPPGTLSFTLPDEPHLVLEAVGVGSQIRARPYVAQIDPAHGGS